MSQSLAQMWMSDYDRYRYERERAYGNYYNPLNPYPSSLIAQDIEKLRIEKMKEEVKQLEINKKKLLL